jgi:hypothetical protein
MIATAVTHGRTSKYVALTHQAATPRNHPVLGRLTRSHLAFAVVVVWEKFNQAKSEVAKEAGAAATVSQFEF